MNEQDHLKEELDENNLETTENAADEDSAPEDRPEKASPAARKLEPLVLAHLSRPNYQPVKPRVIAKQLKLPGEQHKALKLCIKRLVQQGKAIYGNGHLVRPVTRGQGSGVRDQKAGGGRKPPDTKHRAETPQPKKTHDRTRSVPPTKSNEIVG